MIALPGRTYLRSYIIVVGKALIIMGVAELDLLLLPPAPSFLASRFGEEVADAGADSDIIGSCGFGTIDDDVDDCFGNVSDSRETENSTNQTDVTGGAIICFCPCFFC